jgi:ubiquinone/menaquinone biosynthesis C-methylase UbiE
MRLAARKLYYFPIDSWESLTGKRNKYQPPRGDIYTGSGDYIEQGNLQCSHLFKLTKIQADHTLLDIGSGIGRTAVRLTQFLNSKGSYEGFDVVKKGVDWCQQKISQDFPNFNFQYVPLHNDLYNTNSKKATEFTFPYSDEKFDTAFLFSVFTHMRIEEIEHYFQEISRVLKPGGQCLATCFIYNKDLESIISNRKDFSFPYAGEGYRLMNKQVTGANIAIGEQRLENMISKAGLQKVAFQEGHWRNKAMKSNVEEFQDVLVVEKPMN